jgi:delta-aminolevulinic acid dehydratase/porphobilinogen synthase
MAEMKKKLDEPIFAYTRVSGKYGINEAQRINKTITNNASR